MHRAHTEDLKSDRRELKTQPAGERVQQRTFSGLTRFLLSPFSTALGLLRPFYPQLIPAAVFLFLLPVVIFLSLSAGWFVWRSVAVDWEEPIYLNYGDGGPPYAEMPFPPLSARQSYDISLRLEIPATDSNYALGNFMISLTILTPYNETLASVRRPAIILPPHRILSLWPMHSRTVHLDIPLLFSFVPGTSRVIAQLELGRKDLWKSIGPGEGRELSVISGVVRGSMRHRGIRGLVTRFPLTAAVASFFVFLVISVLILVAFFLPMLAWRPYVDNAEMLNTDLRELHAKPAVPPLSTDDEPDDEKGYRQRKPRRRNRSSNIKTETSSPALSSRGSPSLRRRRSRLSDRASDD